MLSLIAVPLGVLSASRPNSCVVNLPGLGSLALFSLSADRGYDRPLILAIVLVTGAAIIVLNLLADLVVALVDPRVRLGSATRSLLAPIRQTG